MRTGIRIAYILVAVLLAVGGGPTAWAQDHAEGDDGHGSASRYSDEAIPLEEVPARPRPLIELGPKFLGTGNINQGFRIPTGAVWTPAFIVFGTLRTATQGFDSGVADVQVAEAAARLDLFGNLYLTPTERFLIGFRPLDQHGRFTSYTLHTDGFPVGDEAEDDFQEELNYRINTLFFEGDIGEIFPKLDWDDSSRLDYYISVGRQPLSFQDGLLIDEDAIDMVGLTRANMRIGRLVNTRIAGVFGWGDIDRPAGGVNLHDGSALLFGLFTETDTRTRTVELDALFVTADDSTGSGVYGGVGSSRRLGQYNNTFRIVGSYPVGDETPFNRPGALVLNQIGFTPHHSHNWAYLSLFGGIGQFRSAARGPLNGGPLGQAGLLFSSPGIGRLGEVIGSFADKAVGGSLGYQMFFGPTRRQHLIVEVGGRYTYADDVIKQDMVGGAARYAFAVGRRGTIILDGFGSYDLEFSEPTFGTRLELAIQL